MMRYANDDDRARLTRLAEIGFPISPLPDHTSISFSLDEVTRLRAGFWRDDDCAEDEALYVRLRQAESRLVERATVNAARKVSE